MDNKQKLEEILRKRGIAALHTDDTKRRIFRRPVIALRS